VVRKHAEIRDGRDDKPIFIHSELDDYGLTPIEFRVYARLARRAGNGTAFESVPKMAKEFIVSDRTIQRALRVLIEAHLLHEQIRPGRTTLYILTPRRAWSSRSQLPHIRLQAKSKSSKRTGDHVTGDTTAGGDMRAGGGVTPQRGVVVTPQPDEGTPIEGTPLKVVGGSAASTPATATNNISDEEFLTSLKANPKYKGIDVDAVLGKMQAWCAEQKKTPSQRRLIQWLDTEDRPLTLVGKSTLIAAVKTEAPAEKQARLRGIVAARREPQRLEAAR
jgi:DNA-binding MarR family transcriptional regulator